MQHVLPNNVAKCCVEMLRAFLPGLKTEEYFIWPRLLKRSMNALQVRFTLLHISVPFLICVNC